MNPVDSKVGTPIRPVGTPVINVWQTFFAVKLILWLEVQCIKELCKPGNGDAVTNFVGREGRYKYEICVSFKTK